MGGKSSKPSYDSINGGPLYARPIRDPQKEADLLSAATRGDVDEVKKLVESGVVNVNCKDKDDRTVLYYLTTMAISGKIPHERYQEI